MEEFATRRFPLSRRPASTLKRGGSQQGHLSLPNECHTGSIERNCSLNPRKLAESSRPNHRWISLLPRHFKDLLSGNGSMRESCKIAHATMACSTRRPAAWLWSLLCTGTMAVRQTPPFSLQAERAGLNGVSEVGHVRAVVNEKIWKKGLSLYRQSNSRKVESQHHNRRKTFQ